VQYVKVRKGELPLPVVVEDDHGEVVVLSLEPAGEKKLGARLGRVTEGVRETVLRLLGIRR
jgi:hypothetical protein